MAWGFAHDRSGRRRAWLPWPWGARARRRHVARELVLMGEDGSRGAVLLRDLLAYAGYQQAAAEVEAVLTLHR